MQCQILDVKFSTLCQINILSFISGNERIQWLQYHKCRGDEIEVIPFYLLAQYACGYFLTRINHVTLNTQNNMTAQ